MSALPPKADMCSAHTDVCFGPKADMCSALANVSFGPKADIGPGNSHRSDFRVAWQPGRHIGAANHHQWTRYCRALGPTWVQTPVLFSQTR